MRIPAPLFALGAAAAIALAGCSGGSTSVSPSMGTGLQSVVQHPVDFQLPHTGNFLTVKGLTELGSRVPYVAPNTGCGTGALMYASQFYTSAVQIYKQAGSAQSPCATITTNILEPQGMVVDSKHNVWIANTGDSNVVMLAKGGTTIKKTLADTGEYPVDVSVDSNGNVFATNIVTTASGPGSVSEWVGGKGTPKNLVVDKGNATVYLCALDANHNLYVGYRDNTTLLGAVVEFVGGKGTGKILKIKFSGTSGQYPGGLEFDSTQDLVDNDQLGPTTNIFELPNGNPQKSFTDPGDPLALALTGTGKDIYITDSSGGAVYEYTYPGFTLKDTITSGLSSSSPPFGLAADPGEKL